MIINNIKLLGSRIIPNPIEVDYWVDIKSDPYGSVIKYYNGSEWVPLITKNDVEHNIDLSNYYTKQQVDSIVGTKVDESYVLTQVNQLGSIKADKSSVYTKAEIDDKGYLTSIPSIYITEEKLYNNVYTKAEVNQKIADAALNGTIDLSNYYTKEEVNNIIPTDTVSTQELSNALQTKQDVITAGNNVSIDNNTINVNIDLSDYALKQDIPSLDEYALKDEIPSLEGYTKIEDVPSLDGYATEQWVNNKGYLTTHQDISHLANKSDVYTKDEVDSLVGNVTVDLSDYYSKTETNTLLSSYAKTNNVYDKATVDQKIADVATSGQVDLSNYYNKQEVDSLIEGIDIPEIPEIPEIPTKTSQLENDVPFATAVALSEGLSLKQNNISDLETIRQGAILGSTALQEHQDISGKLDKTEAQETYQLKGDYATKVELQTKQDKVLKFENKTASTWTEDSTYAEFTYRCDIFCEGVTEDTYAKVVFALAQAISGEYAPVCQTGENTVSIWSNNNTSIIIPTILITI